MFKATQIFYSLNAAADIGLFTFLFSVHFITKTFVKILTKMNYRKQDTIID